MALPVAAGKHLVIDLNGHTLNLGLAEGAAVAEGWVLVNAGTLTIVDGEGGGTITGGNTAGIGGGIYNLGVLTLEGGSIVGNACSSMGGGVYSVVPTMVVGDAGAQNAGKFTMHDGSISNNTATGKGGGIYGAGTTTIEGGSVRDNSSGEWGGGIYLPDASANDGKVAALNLRGGSIADNTCANSGGGVHVSATAKMRVSGEPRVKGNRKGNSRNDVYLAKTNAGALVRIEVAEPLSGEADISVSLSGNTGIFTSGYSDNNAEAPGAFFHARDDGYAVVLRDGEAAVVSAEDAVTVTFDAAGGNDVVDQTVLRGGLAVAPAVPTRDGFEFRGWHLVDPVTGVPAEDAFDFQTEINDDTLLRAAWEEGPALPRAQVLGYTLTLEGEIGVNAYLVLGGAVTSEPGHYCVEVWDGEEKLASTPVSKIQPVEREVGGVSYTAYRFAATTAAKDFGHELHLRLRNVEESAYVTIADRDGSVVNADEGVAYSVEAYLNEMAEGASTDEMATLARDMRAYCTYARHYFAVRDHGLAEEPPSPTVAGLSPVAAADLAPYAYTLPPTLAHFRFRGATLVLEGRTSLRLYFESSDPSALSFTLIPAGGAAGTAGADGTTLEVLPGMGMWYVEVSDIAARRLDDMYNITVTDGAAVATFKHGPLAYALWALESNGSSVQRRSLQRVMEALYRYNQSARSTSLPRSPTGKESDGRGV